MSNVHKRKWSKKNSWRLGLASESEIVAESKRCTVERGLLLPTHCRSRPQSQLFLASTKLTETFLLKWQESPSFVSERGSVSETDPSHPPSCHPETLPHSLTPQHNTIDWEPNKLLILQPKICSPFLNSTININLFKFYQLLHTLAPFTSISVPNTSLAFITFCHFNSHYIDTSLTSPVSPLLSRSQHLHWSHFHVFHSTPVFYVTRFIFPRIIAYFYYEFCVSFFLFSNSLFVVSISLFSIYNIL